jgi:hypothetical protein
MRNILWEQYERCANLCADYKERFGENVPMELLCFDDFETISREVNKALKENKRIK